MEVVEEIERTGRTKSIRLLLASGGNITSWLGLYLRHFILSQSPPTLPLEALKLTACGSIVGQPGCRRFLVSQRTLQKDVLNVLFRVQLLKFLEALHKKRENKKNLLNLFAIKIIAL